MKFILCLMVVLSAATAYADACRDQLVKCVQTTGNPGACQSTYQNCKNSKVSQAPKNDSDEVDGKLNFMPTIRQEVGQTILQLSVTNTAKSAVQLHHVSYQVKCADGSAETITFNLDGMILPTEKPRPIGQPQVACFSTGGAVAMLDAKEAPDQGTASMQPELIYHLTCANGQVQTLTLKQLKDGVYQWNNSQKSRGMINGDTLPGEEFIQLACYPYGEPEPDLMTQAIYQLKEMIRKHRSTPESEPEKVKTKNAGLGERG